MLCLNKGENEKQGQGLFGRVEMRVRVKDKDYSTGMLRSTMSVIGDPTGARGDRGDQGEIEGAVGVCGEQCEQGWMSRGGSGHPSGVRGRKESLPPPPSPDSVHGGREWGLVTPCG